MIWALLLAAAPAAWEPVDTVDGIAMFQRDVEGERVVELKLTFTSKLTVAQLCAGAYGTASLDPSEPDIKVRKLVFEKDGERVTYEQISPPVVNDRDYAVRAKKEARADGSCRVSFAADNSLAPKKPDGFVRIEKLRGSFELVPVEGGTKATYVIFTDPGGSIPAVFIEGSRKKTAIAWVKLVEARAAKLPRE